LKFRSGNKFETSDPIDPEFSEAFTNGCFYSPSISVFNIFIILNDKAAAVAENILFGFDKL
jgi:hypothetical protein